MKSQTHPERVASALVCEANAVIVLTLLSFPGGLAVQLSTPDSLGFYLIALVATAGHVALRRMSWRDRSVETDLSSHEREQAMAVLFALAVVTATVVSLRLGFGVIVGQFVTAAVGKSLLAVFGAALAPFVDYRLSERRRWLSPSHLVAVGLAQLLVAVGVVESDTAESIWTDVRRIDPM